MEKFYFVNSAKFPKQTIENLNSEYLFSFNFLELLKQGFSHVFGADAALDFHYQHTSLERCYLGSLI